MTNDSEFPHACLAKLVEHVFNYRNRLLTGITYKELAARIGRSNRHGQPHPRGMGVLLGKMGHLLQDLEGKWGEPIPHIQSLVVLKTGKTKNLPDDGIKEFWPDYPKMSLAEKENRVQIEHKRIADFGSRWNDVLIQLGIPSMPTIDKTLAPSLQHGAGGESAAHKALKDFVREHPELVGATKEWQSFIEYPLPSLDEIDVLFKCGDRCIAVEVKSTVSDSCPCDYERGLYQTIKYTALLQAMALGGRDIPQSVSSVLVLQSSLPTEYRKLATVLRVIVFENVGLERRDTQAITVPAAAQ
jgi:hypothetical protein